MVLGADRFVVGASALAERLGMSPLIVGMVVVGLGTSAPEILVSATAALEGNAGIAVGNSLGSNIANIGLVLGTAALIRPILVSREIWIREIPVLLAITGVGYLLVIDGHLGRIDGGILLAMLTGVLIWTGRRSRAHDDGLVDKSTEDAAGLKLPVAIVWLVIGLAVLLVGSRFVVWGASLIASSFGVSDLVIGLTIVAIGTSLPELAATGMSAYRGEHELAVGNIIGSNTFNLLAVLPLPGLIAPDTIDGTVVSRDYPVMGLMTVLLFVASIGVSRRGVIRRGEGAILLLCFVAYMAWLGLYGGG